MGDMYNDAVTGVSRSFEAARHDAVATPGVEPENIVRVISRLAGYASLAGGVLLAAYLII